MIVSSDDGVASSGRTFPHLLSDLLASVGQLVSLSKGSLTQTLVPSQFAALATGLIPILRDLKDSEASDTVPLRKAVESLEVELRRAGNLVKNANSTAAVRLMEDSAHDLGRCVGLVLLACVDVPLEIKERLGALHRKMMAVRFGLQPMLLAEAKRVVPGFEELVLRVKNATNEDETRAALEDLGFLIKERMVGDECGSAIPILLNRLRYVNSGNRRRILLLLRSLASVTEDNKERMADVGALSTIVRSLSGDVEESREAMGLLLDLSDVSKVRQRIGRVQSCIVMLVAWLNGDDSHASMDAERLLDSLSSNTQNVLLMAEAGYFVPLVRYLKEGSDMNKIIMATSISRIELTEQIKTALGDKGSIGPLVKMFTLGKLESKLAALAALQNLCSLPENVKCLIESGIIAPLIQLLFSVTSVQMTLREPAAAILACMAKSELILTKRDVAQQMLTLLNISSPAIQHYLLRALNSIACHSSASKVRAKMKECDAVQLLLPFTTRNSAETRLLALSLLFRLSEDSKGKLTEQLGETYLIILTEILSMSVSEDEKATAAGILSNIPASDKKVTEILKRSNFFPAFVSLVAAQFTSSSMPMGRWLVESLVCIMGRFTVPWDGKLQRMSAEFGVIPLLVKLLLSDASPVTKSRAATSLAQFSQNSLALSKAKLSGWMCVPSSSEAFCEVHSCKCTVRSTFCLVKAGAISPLIQLLDGKEREADEAVLGALSTIMQDEMSENGSNIIEKASGVEAIIRILEVGNVKAQRRAIWILERVFRVANHRAKHGKVAQVVLIDLAQKGDPTLKPMIAKILAHLLL